MPRRGVSRNRATLQLHEYEQLMRGSVMRMHGNVRGVRVCVRSYVHVRKHACIVLISPVHMHRPAMHAFALHVIAYVHVSRVL